MVYNASAEKLETTRQSPLSRATSFFVYLLERVMPDPFVFALLLTFFGAILAFFFAPKGTPSEIASAWYGGVFTIFAFAFHQLRAAMAAEANRERWRAGGAGARAVARQLNDVG